MFWTRNKENSFPIGTLIWRPVSIQVNDHGKYRAACIMCYGKCSITSNTFLFLLTNKMLVSELELSCLKSKQGKPRSDYFFRSSLICVCTVCLDFFVAN